jgi:site-specific recombinase XerD
MNSLPSSHERNTQLALAHAAEAFKQSLQARNASPATIRAYLEDVGQFISWFHDQTVLERVDHVEHRDIEAFLAYLGKKGITGTIRRRKFSALRCFFNCLEMDGSIGKDRTKGVVRPRAEHLTPQILFGHEYKALLYEACDNTRDQAILQVFLQTGIRVGELCALTAEDVDAKCAN